MSKLCRACGLDLSTCKRYERCLLSRQANVLSVLSLLLEEQAQSLGIVLDVSGYLRDGFICRSCLGAYRTHVAKLETLKGKASKALYALRRPTSSQATASRQRKRAAGSDSLELPRAKRCLFAPAPTLTDQQLGGHNASPAVSVSSNSMVFVM